MSLHSKNTFKEGQGLTPYYDKIKEEIRKSEIVQARLTRKEKEKFNKDRGTLTESAYIRKLINQN